MKWFQNIFTMFALLNLVISPVAHAATPELSASNKAQLNQYREYLEPLGYYLKLDDQAKKAIVYDKATDKVVTEVIFSDESKLRKFSPKSLNQMMLNEMVRVKSASKGAWSHSVKSLPSESAMFFVAMGAVVAGQLITNYAQNPVGMKQHIDHSLSPIGVFGFFTFMYSQGVTSNVLAMYMKNPKFHHMIPYLGMTVGAFTQTYLSSIASDPNVKACAKTMMGYAITQKDLESGADQDACGRAYEHLIIQKKIWEFAPGIVSMLISSGMAAVGQSVVTKAVLRITGVDIALWLVPGSMQVKGFRLLVVKGLQITAFVAIDVWLNRKVAYVWKNMFDGADFYDQNDRLVEKMKMAKQQKWSGDDKTLENEVKDFRKKMSDWRMMNMSEVYEAHQAWQESLQQLTSMYNTSYSFYNSIVTEIRSARFDGAETPLAMAFPLSGVTAKDLNDGKEDLYLTNPHFLLSAQLETVNETATKIDGVLASDYAKVLYPLEIKALKNLSALLHTNDEKQAAEGLKALQKIKDDGDTNMSVSSEYRELIRTIWASLGAPSPTSGVGQGYMFAYEKTPATADTLKGTNYYRVVGGFQTPKITDYLVMQMLCGPDAEKGQKSVRNSLGYPSVFNPPKIGAMTDELNACNLLGANLPAENIYSFRMEAGTGAAYDGAISYLLKEARPSVIGTADKEAFTDWWTAKTESQMRGAFDVFTKSYDDIVVKMMKAIYYPGRSFFNGRQIINPVNNVRMVYSKDARKRMYEGGPVFNGGMNSAFQEERVYLALLEEMLNPSKEFSMDIANILGKAPSHPALKEIDNQFAILNSLIQRIKVSKQDGREVIKSDLENYELEEQLTNIQTALKKASEILGVGDEQAQAPTSKLTQRQRDVAVTTFEQLQSLASEVMMYGSMANAVSWDKIRDLKRINTEQQQYNNDIQKKLNAMRGMTLGKN